MPKIGKERFYINGEYREFEIHYNRTNSFFLKDFPQDVWLLSSFKREMGASTEGLLMSNVRQALHEYHIATESKKKVIKIDLILGTDYLMNKQSEGSYLGNKKNVDREFARKVSGSLSRGVPPRGISFTYSVCWVVSKNGLKFHRLIGDDGMGAEMGGESVESCLYIDFTPERLEFMQSIDKTFDMIADKFIGFFSKDELGLQIDASKGNLIGQGNDTHT